VISEIKEFFKYLYYRRKSEKIDNACHLIPGYCFTFKSKPDGGRKKIIWEYKDLIFKFQADKLLKKAEISGFIMAPAGFKTLILGVSVGVFLKKN